MRFKTSVWLFVELWFWCSIQSRYKWKIYWLSTEGCSIKLSPNYSMLLIDWNVFIEVFNRSHLLKGTSDIIPCYYSINNYYSVIIVIIISENLFVRTDQVNSSLQQAKRFFDFLKQSRATMQPSQLNCRNYRVRHILCRRTPPPPKLNLPLINFGVINFLWISARPPSRGQWYHGLIELEVTFLRNLQKRYLKPKTNS